MVRFASILDSLARHKQKAMLTVIVVEFMGIACAVMLKAGAENKTNDEDYQRYVGNREAVITELKRLELARQEDIKPIEALSAMIMTSVLFGYYIMRA